MCFWNANGGTVSYIKKIVGGGYSWVVEGVLAMCEVLNLISQHHTHTHTHTHRDFWTEAVCVYSLSSHIHGSACRFVPLIVECDCMSLMDKLWRCIVGRSRYPTPESQNGSAWRQQEHQGVAKSLTSLNEVWTCTKSWLVRLLRAREAYMAVMSGTHAELQTQPNEALIPLWKYYSLVTFHPPSSPAIVRFKNGPKGCMLEYHHGGGWNGNWVEKSPNKINCKYFWKGGREQGEEAI
jgi:hypothetical protein